MPGSVVDLLSVKSCSESLDWIGLCSVLRPHQHSIGYTGDEPRELCIIHSLTVEPSQTLLLSLQNHDFSPVRG